MTNLNEQALEAACEAYNKFECGTDIDHVHKIITAYLNALPSVDVDGLVERLETGDDLSSRIEAASLIQSQAARIAELEADGRFLVDRLNEFDLTDDANEMCRDFNGHVRPAHERLEALLNRRAEG